MLRAHTDISTERGPSKAEMRVFVSDKKKPRVLVRRSCCGVANDGFISLVTNRSGRDVHCIVGVGRSWESDHTLCRS